MLGIDIGGTKIRIIFVNKKRILRSYTVPTPKSKKAFIKLICGLYNSRQNNLIGVGVAGVIKKFKVIFSPNISYLRNFDFCMIFKKAIISVDNDARCFARTECTLGAGKKFRKLFAITIGTGIGRAYAEKRVVKKIKNFEYPEPWEKEYQRIRDGGDDKELAFFLGKKLFKLTSPYRPTALVIGGGVLERKLIIPLLRQELQKRGFLGRILCSRFRKNAVAIGAVLTHKFQKPIGL